MASVVGLTVHVKLRHPPNTSVYGVVKDLVPNSHLTLNNVFFPGSNARWEHWSVQATAIEDLEVVQPAAVPAPPPPPQQQFPPAQVNPPPGFANGQGPIQSPPGVPNAHRVSSQPFFPQLPPQSSGPFHIERPPPPAAAAPAPTELPTVSTPQKAAFVDPAIISYGNTSPKRSTSAMVAPTAATPIKSMLARAAANLPSPGSPFIADLNRGNMPTKMANPTARQHSIAQSPSRKATPAQADKAPSGEQVQVDAAATKKKVRRGQKTKKPSPPALETVDPPPIMNSEVSRHGNDMNGNVKRGKGWRSTPLLQPSPATAAPIEKVIKKSRRKQKEELDALGDTTDIADMGDFDFEGELKKFDKKQVFDEIRQGDTTADEDRLVSHNRVARPGTHGGKNLHPTEPVLSPKIAPQYNSNEVDSSSDADTELNLAVNGRSSSKHSVSRQASSKVRPSRQNSGQVERPHPLTTALSSDRNRNLSATSLVARGKSTSLAASSPRPSGSPHSAAPKSADSHFAISPHGHSCPTLFPIALDSLELAAVSTFGLSHDAVTENAARAIADSALHLADLHSGIRRPSRQNTFRGSLSTPQVIHDTIQDQPTIVVLAGNHPIGARALAAARHLLGRNARIIAAESLYENAEVQDQLSKSQTAILRRMSRGGANIKRGLWRRVSQHIKNLSGPPAVIIDALLAGSTYDSLLTSNAAHSDAAQLETREMIDWANRSRAPVLSIACPSGVSGIDGISTIVEGEPLSIRPDRILALGAPMQGLLKAMDNGEETYDHISVADIGINIALKSDEAVAFGHNWTVDVKYVEGFGTGIAATSATASAGGGGAAGVGEIGNGTPKMN